MDLAQLATLHAESLAAVRAAADAAALEQARIRYLGRNGLLPAVMKRLRDVPPAERPEFGRRANAWRSELEAALRARAAELAARPAAAAPPFDFSLPGRWWRAGAQHPVSRVIDEIVRIFGRLGFTVADGPDIETRFNNFTALNTPDHHPSMDATDTFWLDDDKLLRTQTSPVQIRVMLSRPPPVRVVTPGRCYRRDTTDATHSANFHQVEGLYVDTRPVSLADLKATLTHFARELLGPQAGVRFRPHFFPFTEPSVEVDFSCHLCGGRGCPVCKQSGWIEIAGAGMVDPRVYEHVGYDPDGVYGYAFGMGVERVAMIRHGIADIRQLYENDLRFLEQFA
jgi:phenylalanyl-tRNA synthetase alpha chain